ncbi:MAG: hypothetical protein ACSHYA_14055 [Opitutaceae bacterium]
MALSLTHGAEQSILLETANLEIEYAITDKDVLKLKHLGARDQSWSSPLGGPVFPSEPHRGGNGSRLVPNLPMIRSGAEWMQQGVTLTFTQQFDSAAIVFDSAY